MSTLPSTSLYRFSGQTTLAATAAGLILALLSGALVGALYGAIGFAIHIIPALKLVMLLELLALIGMCLALGMGLTHTLLWLKSRSVGLNVGYAFLAAAVALYFAWFAWIFAYHKYSGLAPDLSLLFPHNLLQEIRFINNLGPWSIDRDIHPTGVFLSLFWLIEAFCLLIVVPSIAKNQTTKRVFCEHCQTWGSLRPLMHVQRFDLDQLRSELAAGKIDMLCTARPSSLGDESWMELSLEGCSTCDNLQTLNVDSVNMVKNKEGAATRKVKKIIRRYLLTPDQTAQLAMAAANNQLPAPPADPPQTL